MLDERAVQAALTACLREPARVVETRELAGDASTRRYYRVRLAPGSPIPSIVLMRYPDDLAPGEELPFVNVHRYLERSGVPVPKIYHAAPEAHLLLLEDAGDTMLEDAVAGARSPDEYLPLYERCMEILVRIQWDGTRALDNRALPGRLAFDVPKFVEEIGFFFRHAVGDFGGIALAERERRAMEDLFLPVLEELAALPRILAHRDYHSRNVMVLPAGGAGARPDLRILDFQDARMGSVFYDLASILRDSYATLPEKTADDVIYAWRHAAPGDLRRIAGEGETFHRRLSMAALQRNVKAIGTFGNQAANRGKTLYLRYIPPTVAHLRGNFERNPPLRPLGRRLLPILDALAAKAAAEAPS